MTFLLIPIDDSSSGSDDSPVLGMILLAICAGGAALLHCLTPGVFAFVKAVYTFDFWSKHTALTWKILCIYMPLALPLLAVLLLRDKVFGVVLSMACAWPLITFCYSFMIDKELSKLVAVLISLPIAFIVLMVFVLLLESLENPLELCLEKTFYRLPGADDSDNKVCRFFWFFTLFILIPGGLWFFS